MTFLAVEVRTLVGSWGRVLTDHGAMVNCFLIVVSIVFCYEFDLEAKLTTKKQAGSIPAAPIRWRGKPSYFN